MRVTNKLMADMVANNFFKSTDRLLETENLIASGKRINKPSDDPVGIVKVIEYRKAICAIDQHISNIDHGESWLNITDSTLASVDTLLIRAREIAEYQGTETATEQTRVFAAEEITNIYDQIVQLGNTKLGNSYIFAGHQTDTSPFSRDADYNATYGGDDGDIRTIIGEGVDLRINVTGKEVFDDGIDIFGMLKDLKEGLENDDTEAISGQIASLEGALGQILKVRADVGSRLNRLETTRNYHDVFKFNITDILSRTEDADLTKAMTDLTMQEAAFQASLSAAARIIQPSLLNFLK